MVSVCKSFNRSRGLISEGRECEEYKNNVRNNSLGYWKEFGAVDARIKPPECMA